jgi:hypothetical protein
MSSNSYCGVKFPPSVGVAAVACSVGLLNVSSRTPLIGACGVGAEAFSVAPPAGVTTGGVGVVGVRAFDFAHANDSDKAMSEAALRTVSVLCCIFYCSIVRTEKDRRAGKST